MVSESRTACRRDSFGIGTQVANTWAMNVTSPKALVLAIPHVQVGESASPTGRQATSGLASPRVGPPP